MKCLRVFSLPKYLLTNIFTCCAWHPQVGVRFINTSGDPDVAVAAYVGETVTNVRFRFVLRRFLC